MPVQKPNGRMPTPVPTPSTPIKSPLTPGLPSGNNRNGFEGSRSPPNHGAGANKNLSHVPCRFYLQNACQAGKACPFSHDTNSAQEPQACQYFKRGNCKFGHRCANVHVLPNGTKVNNPTRRIMRQTMPSDHFIPTHPGGAHAGGHHTPNRSLNGQEEFPPLPHAQPIPQINRSMVDGEPLLFPGSPGGLLNSPLLGTSHTSQRTLGPLDAKLPESFGNYDYSHYAKYGPFAASVPSKIAPVMDSPPSSYTNNLASLRQSAFGDDSGSEVSNSFRRGEDIGQRIMHSKRLTQKYPNSYAGAHVLDDEFATSEGDLLPESLSDLLTQDERSRRMSRPDADNQSASRYSITAPGTPGHQPIAFGSPSAGSPARSSLGPLVPQSRQDELPSIAAGVVGSPLRHGYLQETIPAVRSGLARSVSNDANARPGYLPRGGGVSALTESLRTSTISGQSEWSVTEQMEFRHSLDMPERPSITSYPSRSLTNGNGTIDEEPAEPMFGMEIEEGNEGPLKQVGGFGPPTSDPAPILRMGGDAFASRP